MKDRILLLLGCALLSVSAAAQSNWEKISAEGLRPSPLESNLQVLTDQIGGRVPGTAAMDKAIRWGLDSFRAAGGDNVHVEPFTIAQSWAEGATRFHVTAPINFRVRAVSFGWSPAIVQPGIMLALVLPAIVIAGLMLAFPHPVEAHLAVALARQREGDNQ